MSNIIEESFAININVMLFLGLYPGKNDSVFKKVRCITFYFISLVIVSCLTFINLLTEEISSNIQTNFMVMFLAEAVGAIFKLIPFFKNGRKVQKCVTYFGQLRFTPMDDVEKELTEGCVKFCRRISKIYFYGVVSSNVAWVFLGLLAEGRYLPLNIWLPYDFASDSITYYITFFTLAAFVPYDAFLATITDPLIGGLAYHATSQIKILKHNLQHLDEGVRKGTQCGYHIISYAGVRQNLERCIRLHNDILDFITEYEECFSWPVFCQLASSTSVLCFGCITLILAPTALTFEGIQSTAVSMVTMFQIFFYCYFGTLLYEENNGLNDAIYMGPWYKYDFKVRKMLFMIMERSKKPIILTSGKVINLTLATFATVLKTSYSLIAVFNNYQ